jgi:hypothetical protein
MISLSCLPSPYCWSDLYHLLVRSYHFAKTILERHAEEYEIPHRNQWVTCSGQQTTPIVTALRKLPCTVWLLVIDLGEGKTVPMAELLQIRVDELPDSHAITGLLGTLQRAGGWTPAKRLRLDPSQAAEAGPQPSS